MTNTRSTVARAVPAAVALVVLAPAVAAACPICFGLEPGSDEARSLNWAVFTLLGVTGGVLSGFVGFMFHLLKRSRQALGSDPSFDAAARRAEPGGES
ncbi:MAG: hypothetical protein OXH75_14280 [Acidobacteria bacterium]|nr:hypothetical protein [Acidobacteriota bacterium]